MVAYHPTARVEMHEQRGYAVLHGLLARLVGGARASLTRSDRDEISEPVAALLLELPQREIGGALPEWDILLAQTAWAREHDVALHLDAPGCGSAFPPSTDRPPRSPRCSTRSTCRSTKASARSPAPFSPGPRT